MHKWLAQSSLRQEVDRVYPTTNHPCLSRSRFEDPQSLRGAPVPNRGVPEKEDVLGGTGYIWKYPCSIMFQRYVSHLQSNYHRRARNRVQRGVFARHLQIGKIQFWSCPVHAWDDDLSRFSFAGWTIELAESRVRTDIDLMDSIVLSTCDACCTIQLLCHTLCPPHFPLQLPAHESLSWLDQGYRWDQAAEGLLVLRWEYLQVVVHLVRCLWVDH